MSLEFRHAAWVLWERGAYRASLGRAYYAAYAELSDLLASRGATWSSGREGPSHGALIKGFLIEAHLVRGHSASERSRLVHHITSLYRLRLIADYRPSIGVGEFDAKLGLSHMQRLVELVEKSR